MERSELEDRAAGCLAGVAIGDAMGLPTQFMRPEDIEAEFGSIDGFERAPGWHPYGDHQAGSVTDDTEQTLALADELLSRGGHLTTEAAATALLGWAKERGLLESDQIGPSTGEALRRIESGTDPDRTGFKGVTNGASMRISPVGIVNPRSDQGSKNELVGEVQTACRATHNTPVAISGAAAVAGAITEGVSGTSDLGRIIQAGKQVGKMAYGKVEKELPAPEELDKQTALEVMSGRVSPSLNERIDFAIEVVRGSKKKEVPRRLYDLVGTGVRTIETVPAAFALLAATEGGPIEAVKLAANAGGDTDTLGAIAGGIAGAHAGLSGFPGEYLAKVEAVNDLNIEDYAEKLVELRLKRGE